MNQGILFYTNHGTPVPLFVVAVYSLRKYYSGNIHVVLGEDHPEFFREILNKTNDISYSIVKKRYFDKQNLRRSKPNSFRRDE